VQPRLSAPWRWGTGNGSFVERHSERTDVARHSDPSAQWTAEWHVAVVAPCIQALAAAPATHATKGTHDCAGKRSARVTALAWART
jgi:hypothetical protein